MNKKVRDDLDALLNKHDENVKRDKVKETEKKTVEDTFGRDFERIKNDVIRPAMSELGEYMKKRGHEYEITDGKEDIQLSVKPSGFASELFNSHHTPLIRFSGNKSSKKVEIYESTMKPIGGGEAGTEGAVEIKEITNDFAQQCIVQWLTKVFDIKYFR